LAQGDRQAVRSQQSQWSSQMKAKGCMGIQDYPGVTESPVPPNSMSVDRVRRNGPGT
jgi:hypothetical protein